MRRSLERRQILDILAAAGAPVAVKDIMRAAGIGRRSAADIMLGRMAADGEVARTGRGRYALPNLSGEAGKIAAIDCQAPDETAQNGNLSNLSAVFTQAEASEDA